MNKPSKTSESPVEERTKTYPDETPGSPIGAILITSFLALMILISWFGMYFLDFLRG